VEAQEGPGKVKPGFGGGQEGIPDDINSPREALQGAGGRQGDGFVFVLFFPGGIDKDEAPPGRGRQQGFKAAGTVFLPDLRPASGNLYQGFKIFRMKFKANEPVLLPQQPFHKEGRTRVTVNVLSRSAAGDYFQIPPRHGRDLFPFRKEGEEFPHAVFPFPVMMIQTRPRVSIDAEEGLFFLPEVIKTEDEDPVFKDIRSIPRMKSVTVTEHIIMIQNPASSCYSPPLS
jgi:hypothetical protein